MQILICDVMSDQIFLGICSPVHITEKQSKVAHHYFLNNVPSIKENYDSVNTVCWKKKIPTSVLMLSR